ncbi:TetR/AcrR family transcriptional regulator [Mycobacterium sp.]|uniref:TetR/AcrR family transcriptional regulator n=1 Tax=Mycobacterium sp. TaxID=1785 RepID=UPI00333F67C9
MAATGDDPQRTRVPAGAAVLQADVTEAIRQAFFTELAQCGYGRLSIEAVARRAGVGKPAIYRRWRSKQDMAVALISEVAWAHLDMPDTGSLEGDVIAFLRAEYAVLTDPLAKAIIPDLLSEANRNPALEAALLLAVRDPRRTRAAAIIRRAIERGEVAATLNPNLALDVLAGPLCWRLAVVHQPLGDAEELVELAHMVMGAFTCVSALPGHGKSGRATG